MAYIQPKPILRQQAWLELQSTLVKNITYSNPFQNCLNCQHWEFGNDQCGLYKAKPPTEILIYSCPDHKDNNDIPF